MAATPAAPTQTSSGAKSGMAIASLVLGILSLFLFVLWPIALPLGLIAVGLGLSARKAGGGGLATAGLICGSIGSIIGLGLMIAVLATS